MACQLGRHGEGSLSAGVTSEEPCNPFSPFPGWVCECGSPIWPTCFWSRQGVSGIDGGHLQVEPAPFDLFADMPGVGRLPVGFPQVAVVLRSALNEPQGDKKASLPTATNARYSAATGMRKVSRVGGQYSFFE